ncbi:MAG: arginyl-tRNA synthetase [Solirubrobacteraceae bacterium]|nr:arginyl-tRNA synthetase [Solirubrobacteraceae bacterium]
MDPLDTLRAAIEDAAADLRGSQPPPRARPSLERPPKPEFGDFSTNAAMLLAPVVGEPPRTVAERLGTAVRERLGEQVERVEIAGPGFLNLFMADAWYAGALADVLAEGEAFGRGGVELSERVNVEFVSANPTGPLHLGHARNAAYGDAIARLLEFHGHNVHREFYVNDAGSQIRRFGEAIVARARGEEPEEYLGGYVADLAAAIPDAASRDPDEVAREGIELVLAGMRETLARFRVADFDTWFHERDLYRSDPPGPTPIEHALESLGEQGATFRSEDALWLRSSAHGDDKDRVLVKSDGTNTYLAPDIAYHQNKRERGFERMIDVWGADHHGYVTRMKAAYAALGGDPDELELLIMQFVNLVRGGEPVSMSKRAGEFITLDELMDEIGVDAARWYLLARSHETTIEVDLDLATRESADNPVYYVQYAHARIASLIERADGAPDPAQPGAPLEAAERALVKKLLAFPSEVAEAAERRAPHRVATYALDLAREFTTFYERCRVVGAETEAFRLALCEATERAIARALDLLGVEAPSSM